MTTIKAAALITNSSLGIIRDAFITFENDRITQIGKWSDYKSDSEKKSELIDLGDCILSAGFVQTHIHLCQTLFRGLADDLYLLDWLQQRIFPFENAHSETSMTSSAEIGILELLSNGTTTIMDMGSVRHYESVLETVKKTGLRGYFGKALMDENPLYPKLSESAKSALDSAQNQLKKYHHSENDRLRYAMTPRFILSCSDELMIESHAVAKRNSKVLYHTHSSEQQAELAAINKRCGMDNVEYFEHLGLLDEQTALAHCIWLNEREIKLMQERKVRLLHCPSSNLKLGSGIAQIPELLEAGVQISLGADGAPCNNNLDPFVEMRLAALIQKPRLNPTVMNAKTVYELATIEGAKSLGWNDEIGSLEVGKKADIIALNLNRIWNPLLLENDHSIYSAIVYSAQRENVSDVWIDGKAIKRKNELVGVDEGKTLDSARMELKRLLGRVDA